MLQRNWQQNCLAHKYSVLFGSLPLFLSPTALSGRFLTLWSGFICPNSSLFLSSMVTLWWKWFDLFSTWIGWLVASVAALAKSNEKKIDACLWWSLKWTIAILSGWQLIFSTTYNCIAQKITQIAQNGQQANEKTHTQTHTHTYTRINNNSQKNCSGRKMEEYQICS